jgi:hypothetical protein
MVAVRTSETSVYLNETTRCYIPEGCIPIEYNEFILCLLVLGAFNMSSGMLRCVVSYKLTDVSDALTGITDIRLLEMQIHCYEVSQSTANSKKNIFVVLR